MHSPFRHEREIIESVATLFENRPSHPGSLKIQAFSLWKDVGTANMAVYCNYLTIVFIGKIVSFIKCVLYPDKVTFEISQLKVGNRNHGWDHRGRNSNKRS